MSDANPFSATLTPVCLTDHPFDYISANMWLQAQVLCDIGLVHTFLKEKYQTYSVLGALSPLANIPPMLQTCRSFPVSKLAAFNAWRFDDINTLTWVRHVSLAHSSYSET